MVKNGFLRLLVQFDKMAEYWDHMLKEYQDHPAANRVLSSAPLSLYGALMATYKDLIGTPGPRSLQWFFFDK